MVYSMCDCEKRIPYTMSQIPPPPVEEEDVTTLADGTDVAPGKKIAMRRRDWKVTYWAVDNPGPRLHMFASEISYAVWQRERCPSTKKIHWQCFVRFHAPRSPNYVRLEVFNSDKTWVSQMKPGTATRARDTPEECRKYCMKNYTRVTEMPDSGPFEMGDFQTSQEKTPLAKVRKRVQEGATLDDLLKDEEVADAVMRSHQGVKAVIDSCIGERGLQTRNDLQVHVYTGAAGAGKSRLAYDTALKYVGGNARDVFRFPPPMNGKIWWGSYRGQMAVIMDDYHDWFPWSYLLNVTDRYPMEVEYKGGHIYLCATLIIFTSNVPLEEWRSGGDRKEDVRAEHRAAFDRRVAKVVHFPAIGVEPVVLRDVTQLIEVKKEE